MRRRRSGLTDYVARNTWLFAEHRLNDPAMLEWALSLKATQPSERHALRSLVEAREEDVRGAFREAWEWVFEHWDRPDAENSLDRLMLKQQFKRQTNPRELIRLVADAVRPWLNVKNRRAIDSIFGPAKPTKPRSARDMFYASVSSGEILKPEDIGLNDIEDLDFLKELAVTLTACIVSGLNLAASIREITPSFDYTDSLVKRVYFVPTAQHPDGGSEPDIHGHGLAPSVKLLSAIVQRIGALDGRAARRIVSSWDTVRWRLFRRMWAAAARSANIASGEEVERFLVALSSEEFWVHHSCPEIAELRAVRWPHLTLAARRKLERRIRRGRPPSLFPYAMDDAELQSAVRRAAVVELLRIKAGGGQLASATEDWLTAERALLTAVPEVDSATFGFDPGVIVRHGAPELVKMSPGDKANPLAALRGAVGVDYWDDASKVARRVVSADPGAALLALTSEALPDVEAAPLWGLMARYFRPGQGDDDQAVPGDVTPVAESMCRSISGLADEVIESAAEALCTWLNHWAAKLPLELVAPVWVRLWPFAAIDTNRTQPTDDDFENVVHASAVSELIHALFKLCPNNPDRGALSNSPLLSAILDEITKVSGTSRLAVVYLAAQNVGYFYSVEPEWAVSNIMEPLKNATGVGGQMWSGLARARMPQPEVMEYLGPRLVSVVMEGRLKDTAESTLVELAVLSILLDREQKRNPSISDVLAQQMLRMGDDAVRAQAVDTMKNFLSHRGVALLDRRVEVVREVFTELWPKERSLRSRLVSDALAALPAASGAHFAAVERLVAPHLTPFDCWSLWEYGVLGHGTDDQTIHWVDSKEDAGAFLDLLDRTIGEEEGAVVPHGLDKALAHIASKSKKLESDLSFRRLLTLARR